MLLRPSPMRRGLSASCYGRRPRLILINGLAEQAESWYANLDTWRRHFDVYQPNLLAYEGVALHRRIAEGQSIDIEYLTERLHEYLEGFVQAPPYYLAANSLGGKVAVEYAIRHPERVSRLVLLCPSGLAASERLPVLAGVRRNDVRSVVASVFTNPRRADPGLVTYYETQFANRRWRLGLLRTIRGTMDHRVHDRLSQLTQPTLVVIGREDRIVDPRQAIAAAQRLPRGHVVVMPHCGHAPQIEQAEIVNRLVIDFLQEEGAAGTRG